MNVGSVLISGGVIRQRLVAEGFGEARPVASNASDDGRARNRRVEV
jgi:chemotaxis protein MotB